MIKQESVLALIVIAAGVFLRVVRLTELFHFTYDESVFAYVGRRMFIQGHIPLIGGVTPFHVHLAPYFYWLSGILLKLGNFYPQALGIFATVLSGITMLLIYLVGRHIFGKIPSLFALLFYAFSFLINIYDRHYWGLVFNPFVSVLVFWSLVEIVKGKEKFILLLAATLAFGFHTDPSSWVLLVVAIITLWFYRPVSRRMALVGTLVFPLSFLPLIVFDIRHQGVNILGFKQYLEETRKTQFASTKKVLPILTLVPRTLARTIYVFGDTDLARQYAYCQHYSDGRLNQVSWWLSVLVFGILIMPYLSYFSNYTSGESWLRKLSWISLPPPRWFNDKTVRTGLFIIAIYFGSIILGAIIYGILFGGVLFDHYFSTSFPFFAFLIGLTVSLLWKRSKWLTVFLLVLFISGNMRLLFQVKHSFGYLPKVQAVQWVIREIGDRDFALESLGSCFKYSGYRYLFTAYGKEPIKSYVDQNFFWLYDRLPAEEHPDVTVVFVSPAEEETEEFRRRYKHFLSGTMKSARFSGIEVLIVDNRTGKYNGNY